jgi:DNA-binding SARP family transcriptional activator
MEAAWRAISLEPLLESAHGALIDAHLAAGNVRDAVRSLHSFAAVLDREIGIAPSPDLVSRVNSAVQSRRAGTFSVPGP